MKKISIVLVALFGLASLPAFAADAGNIKSAKQLASDLTIYAKKLDKNAVVSAEAGQQFYTKKVDVKGKDLSCAACHTDNPAKPGKHNESGKEIPPMSPNVNADRFKDVQKSAKGFSKHCRDLYGKDCAPADKASFIEYVLTSK